MLPFRTRTILLAGAVVALAPVAAHARDPAGDPYRDTVTVGMGVATLPDYEGSDDYRIVPVPAAVGSIGGYGFLLAGNQFSVDLVRDRPGPVWDVQAGPTAQINFNRAAPGGIADRRVRALGGRGTAIELGGYVGLGKTGVLSSPYDKLSVTLGYRHDIGGVHDSGIWNPAIVYLTPLSPKAAISVVAAAEIVGQGYARTYYDVSPIESAASGLPAHRACGGLKNWTIGVIGGYSLTGDLLHGVKIVGGGTYGRMAGAMARSPLVAAAGSRDQWLGTIGLAYTF